jgi:hypothetical protein
MTELPHETGADPTLARLRVLSGLPPVRLVSVNGIVPEPPEPKPERLARVFEFKPRN